MRTRTSSVKSCPLSLCGTYSHSHLRFLFVCFIFFGPPLLNFQQVSEYIARPQCGSSTSEFILSKHLTETNKHTNKNALREG